MFCIHPFLFYYSSYISSQSSQNVKRQLLPAHRLKNNPFQVPNATVKAAECFSNLPHKAFNCGLTWSNCYSAKTSSSSLKTTCNWHPYAKVMDFLAVQSAVSGTWKTWDLLIWASAFDFSPCWVQGKGGRKSPLSFNDQMRAIRAIALMLIWNSLAGHLPEGNQSPTTSGSTNYNTREVIRVALHTDWQINARLGLWEGNSTWLTACRWTSIADESWT